MKNKSINIDTSTNDLIIRSTLREDLEKRHSLDKKVRIINELGVQHGTSRVDIAVVNGILHGYEIKSDKDTLNRLPKQVAEFNSVFDKVTLVVGKRHLFDAIQIVPDWWGIVVAKIRNNSVVFNTIRGEEFNTDQDSICVAKLLWKEEAIKILEENGKAEGFHYKPRKIIYERLATVLDKETLSYKVRETLFFRTSWRPDAPLRLNGD